MANMGAVNYFITSFFVMLFCANPTVFCANLPTLSGLPTSPGLPNLQDAGTVMYSSQSSMSTSELGPDGKFHTTVQTESTGPDGNTVIHSQNSNGSDSITSIQGQNVYNCGPLQCPQGTVSCVTLRNTSPDYLYIYTQYICASITGQNLAEQKTTANNTSKNFVVNSKSIHTVGPVPVGSVPVGYNPINSFPYPQFNNFMSNIRQAVSNWLPFFSFAL